MPHAKVGVHPTFRAMRCPFLTTLHPFLAMHCPFLTMLHPLRTMLYLFAATRHEGEDASHEESRGHHAFEATGDGGADAGGDATPDAPSDATDDSYEGG